PGLETVKAALRMTPDVLAELAYSYELAGDKKETAATYTRAANAAPHEIKYQLSAAQANIADGDPDKGKQFLTRAQAIDSNHYRLHAIRAGLAKTEGRKDEAIKEYLFAIAHLPESAPEGQLYPILLHMNLAELY